MKKTVWVRLGALAMAALMLLSAFATVIYLLVA